jgi:hypothetical protein
MTLNNACGTSENSESYISKIKAIIGDCDCGCKDCGDDIWVVGACGSSGTSEFDPSGIYTYIDNINTNLTNLINDFGDDIQTLTTLIGQLSNKSWFEGLDTDCLVGFPGAGSEEDKKQHIIDLLCDLKDSLSLDPVAQNDISTTVEDVAVEKLVTLNDFFQTDATVTIITAPSNGAAVVLGDDKTLKYTPAAGWTGTDTVGYTLTDSNGNTSTAVWTITVNAVPAVSCSTVEASYSASFYPMGTFLQIAIQNLSSIGTNVLTAKNYIIEIRDVSNAILLSYSVTGSLTVDPTIFTTPVPFAANWNNVRIQQTITTQSATGAACGTVVYETPTPFLLTDVSLSWFYGTTPPACLNLLSTDTEIEKKDKLMNKICSLNTDIEALGDDLDDLEAQVNAINPSAYTVISGDLTVNALLPDGSVNAREYADGRISINASLENSGGVTIPINTQILTDLPIQDGGGNRLILATVYDLSAGTNTPVYLEWGILSGITNTQGAITLATGDTLAFYLTYNKL